MNFAAVIYASPETETEGRGRYTRTYIVDNGPAGDVVYTFEADYPGQVTARATEIRAALAALGLETLPGFADLDATISFELVDGRYVGIQPA